MPVYKPGTSATQIMTDGWSKSLSIEQTIQELKDMGYNYTHTLVSNFRNQLAEEYETIIKKDNKILDTIQLIEKCDNCGSSMSVSVRYVTNDNRLMHFCSSDCKEDALYHESEENR